MTTINYDHIKHISEEKLPVFAHYDGQLSPQSAYIEMDENGELKAGYTEDIGGGITANVWHFRNLRFYINPHLSGSEILEFVEQNLDLFERLHKGHTIEWDGHNRLGSLDECASKAMDRLKFLIYNLVPSNEVWRVEDWLFNADDLSIIWPPDKTLEECAKNCEDAVDDNQVIIGDFEDALIEKVYRNYIYGCDDKLLPHHVRELAKRDFISIDEAEDWIAREIWNRT